MSPSRLSGEGIDALRADLAALDERVRGRAKARGGARLAIDRVFRARGHGVVVTGSLRGGSVGRGQTMRVEPGGLTVRIREAQVHGSMVETTPDAGRVALNLTGVEREPLARGLVLVAGPAVQATSRLLVELRPSAGSRPLVDGATLRVHLATAETLARLRLVATSDPSQGGDTRLGALILAEPIAAALDDRFVLRWPSPAATGGGGRVLDPAPPARLVRRRLDGHRLAALALARDPVERFGALVAAHRVLSRDHADAAVAVLGEAADALAASWRGRARRACFVDPRRSSPRGAAAVAVADAQGRPDRWRQASRSSHRPGSGGAASDGRRWSLAVRGRRCGHRAWLVERGALVRQGGLDPRGRPCADSTGVAASCHGPPGGGARRPGAAVTGGCGAVGWLPARWCSGTRGRGSDRAPRAGPRLRHRHVRRPRGAGRGSGAPGATVAGGSAMRPVPVVDTRSRSSNSSTAAATCAAHPRATSSVPAHVGSSGRRTRTRQAEGLRPLRRARRSGVMSPTRNPSPCLVTAMSTPCSAATFISRWRTVACPTCRGGSEDVLRAEALMSR